MKQRCLYQKADVHRLFPEDKPEADEYRTPFRRDFARVVHSHGFRRLAGKTQLFPSSESDFFRNRLTHSLEVAQIAKTIAIKLNGSEFAGVPELQIDLDLVELAGLAHDLGHPPFGHQGEEILADCMRWHGGFEGNAQTMRLLTKIEKKVHNGRLSKGGFDDEGQDRRHGLNLTYRSLAAVLKYEAEIPMHSDGHVQKGYYSSERDLVEKIKQSVTKGCTYEGPFKTIECSIMDVADDITYSTYDLEDAFKAGFISPLDMLIQERKFYDDIGREVSRTMKEEVTYDEIINVLSDLIKFMFDLPTEHLKGLKSLSHRDLSKEEYLFLGQQYSNKYNRIIVKNGYVRTNFSSQLIKDCINNIKIDINEKCPALSTVGLNPITRKRVEILKRVAFQTQVLSPKLKAREYAGKNIVKEIFTALAPDNQRTRSHVPELLPDDYKNLYQQCTEEHKRYRIVCDFIACMTDRYATEFYGRIKSLNPVSIFIPFS